MRKILLILLSLVLASAPALAENFILYTSSDGKIVTPYQSNVFGANIVSNTYENGQGKIMFDGEVTTIGDYAFAGCDSLTSVRVHWDNLDNLEIHNLTFAGNSSQATLSVPSGTADMYRATSPWSDFGKIEEFVIPIGDVNGDGELTPVDIALTVEFVHGRRPEGGIPEAADANGDGKYTPIDVSLVVSYVLAGTNQLNNQWKPRRPGKVPPSR